MVFFCDRIAFTPADEQPADLLTPTKTASAYLRAALAEYAALSDVLKKDLEHRKPPADSLSHIDSKNPFLFLLYELRNANLHLEARGLMHATTPIRVHDQLDLSGEGRRLTIWTARDLPRDYLRNRLVRRDRLTRAEFDEVLAWFIQQQRRNVIAEMIHTAVHLYGNAIVERCLGGAQI